MENQKFCVPVLRLVHNLVYLLDVVDRRGPTDEPPLHGQRYFVTLVDESADRQLQPICINQHVADVVDFVRPDAEELELLFVQQLWFDLELDQSSAGPLHTQFQLVEVASGLFIL